MDRDFSDHTWQRKQTLYNSFKTFSKQTIATATTTNCKNNQLRGVRNNHISRVVTWCYFQCPLLTKHYELCKKIGKYGLYIGRRVVNRKCPWRAQMSDLLDKDTNPSQTLDKKYKWTLSNSFCELHVMLVPKSDTRKKTKDKYFSWI